MVVEELGTWFETGKSAIDLLKSLFPLLPKGEQRETIEKRVAEAETALRKGDAELAKILGFRLCRCQFPPEIMLWRESEKTNICGKCGHRDPPTRDLQQFARGSGGGPRSRFGGV